MPDAHGDDSAELERLRELVGPSEMSYEQLRADRDRAQQAAKDAITAGGALRGQIAEMSVQLSRARQDQDVLQRQSVMTPVGATADRIVRRWRTSAVPRLARLTRLLPGR